MEEVSEIQEMGNELINKVSEEVLINGFRANVLKLSDLLKILKEYGWSDIEF